MKKEDSSIKLSVIIPFYKTLEETKRLMNVLIPQLTKEIEVILVDDGCFEKELDQFPIKVIHKDNDGVSSARNTGLNEAKGKYIAFIDSDDMISNDYISKILEKTKEKWDYCYISWKMFNQKQDDVIITDEPPTWNTCVWNCIYKSELIGKKRFKKHVQYGEDRDFNDRVRKGIKSNIIDILYHYNVGRNDSLTSQYCRGEIKPIRPFKAQIVMFCRYVSKIGGVETFLYEYFKEFHNKHDILFLYEEADPKQIARYKKFVRCERYYNEDVECEIYHNVNFNKNISENTVATSGVYLDMCHTDYDAMGWKYVKHPKTTMTICVSEASRKSFLKQYPNEPCVTIHNLIKLDEPQNVKDVFKENGHKEGLKLITASRLSWEKGYDRMKQFAKRLNELKKPFTWIVFTDDRPDEDIKGLIFVPSVLNVVNYLNQADYYVTCSNTEADGYSTKEAFYKGVPVIATNYPSIYEQGFVNGRTGYILEMDLSNMDEVIKKMKDILQFEPIKPNHATKWFPFLGKETNSDYVYDPNEPIDDRPDRWIALMRIKDDTGKQIPEGEEPTLYSSERIRILLDHKMIKRKENDNDNSTKCI